MNRTEFLKALRQKLSESMSPREVDEQVRYYDNYIREAIKNGQREEEVMASLGDPVLIARTILESPGSKYAQGPSSSKEQESVYSYQEKPFTDNREERVFRFKQISSLGCIVGVVIFVLVLFLLLRLVGAIMALFFRIAAPILLIILLAILIKNLSRR